MKKTHQWGIGGLIAGFLLAGTAFGGKLASKVKV